MFISIDEVLARIKEGDRVLDLGGWDRIFPRANVVVDLLPYETRRIVYPDIPEQFTKKTWIEADFCSEAFWKTIPDKSFDFIIISHTLEDIRDPLYVCQQMIRCGKAGYIESPSKFRECSKASASDTWSGYVHHRWLIEPMADMTGLLFKAKLSWAHHEDFLGDEYRYLLNHYASHFNGYFWRGSFNYIEYFQKGPELETADLKFFFKKRVNDPSTQFVFDLVENSKHPDNGKCLWVDKYKLPSEVVDA